VFFGNIAEVNPQISSRNCVHYVVFLNEIIPTLINFCPKFLYIPHDSSRHTQFKKKIFPESGKGENGLTFGWSRQTVKRGGKKPFGYGSGSVDGCR
jgi:hypothetical protein